MGIFWHARRLSGPDAAHVGAFHVHNAPTVARPAYILTQGVPVPVFTIFCHGTGEHRAVGDPEELIHALSRKAGGTEYDDFLILDGPGMSGGKGADRMAGSFDAFDRHKGAKGKAPAYSKTSNAIMDLSAEGWTGKTAPVWKTPGTLGMVAQNIGGLFTGNKASKAAGAVGVLLSPLVVPLGAAVIKGSSVARGMVLGEGMDDNIRHAMAAIANKYTDFGGITINMVGWSRGAITCIRMANWMQEFYGASLNINIFAVDPVAGGVLGEQAADTYTVPEVVKNFVALLMLDDKRGGFRPQDIGRLRFKSRATHAALLPLPGRHDTPVMLAKSADLAEVGQLSRYLAYKFLQTLGTVFKDPEASYSAAQICEKYAAMKLKSAQYAALGGKGVGAAAMGGIISRTVTGELDRYVSHSTAFFVDEHHVEAFKLAFPRVYQLVFSASPGIGNHSGATSHSTPAASELGRALQMMFQLSPSSYEVLSKLGVLERRSAGSAGPLGAHHKTVNDALGKIGSRGSTGTVGAGPAFWTVKPSGLYQGDNGACGSGRALLRSLVG
jgi:hypothetical protein